MFKWSIADLCLVGLVAAALVTAGQVAHAQALPSASRGGGTLQIGAGATFLNPDYRDGNNGGVTAYADYDVMRFVGVEAEVHLGGIISPKDITENTYMGGPRGTYHFGRATAYAKALFGRATILDQDTHQSSAFFVGAYGGGLEYLLRRNINIRCIDLEGQKWPGFEPHTLSPYTVTVGVAYVFH